MPRIHAFAVLAVLVSFLSPALADRDKHKDDFEIRTLSNRADLISGGDALVEISVPRDVPLNQVRVRLEDRDVTSAFTGVNATAHTLRGVVTGMRTGRNDLVVDTKTKGHGHGQPSARLVITNHPIGGPVLLGSQTQPWICATPTGSAAAGNTPATNPSGLSTNAVDADCNIATETFLFYRTTSATCSRRSPFPTRIGSNHE